MTNEMQTIDFHGDALACVLKDGVPHVSVRHVCDALGVDFATQRRKLNAVSWGGVVMMTTPDSSGVAQTYAMIPAKSLSMWMATINPRKVGADVRSKLERYQVEAADVLDRYFRQGQRFGVPEPAADGGASLIERLIQQTDVMRQSLVLAAAHEQRLRDAESRVGLLERRADADAVARLAASAELRALPPPTVAIPTKTPIDDVGRLVKAWAAKTGVLIAEAWRRFYEEIRIRLHYDAYARARKYPHGFSKADVLRVESPEGVALGDFHAQVYAIAYSLFAESAVAVGGGPGESFPDVVPMSTAVQSPGRDPRGQAVVPPAATSFGARSTANSHPSPPEPY